MDPRSSSSVFYNGFVPMNEDQRDDGFCNGLADDVPYYDADIGADDVPGQGDGECVDMDDNMNDEVIYTPECTEDMKPYRMIFAPFTGKDNHGKPITFAAGLLANEDFKKEFSDCVWSELIEPEEFDDKWNGIMEKYGLEGRRLP
ncbi:protein FAR1-RELATED SEQUENCE 5-like [Salvia divinorum]|uniref:Protein FAR1-RELATED SEQUENCE 5-like n=1 Tax=Salvia divinorum TaxID=28513 RepID=A0ABD1GZ73_SALDI